jgi:hypothetical protein
MRDIPKFTFTLPNVCTYDCILFRVGYELKCRYRWVTVLFTHDKAAYSYMPSPEG